MLEGIDGSGKETQARLVLERLRRKGIDHRYVHYPEAGKPIGETIYAFLKGNFEAPPITVTLLYVADFTKDVPWIERERASRLLLANRYFTSTLAYEWALGVPLEDLIALADAVHLPVPDAVIYIDVPADVGARRKGKDKDPDRFERNVAFLSRVRENYLYLARSGVFCRRWHVIDGNRPISDVFSDVWNTLRRYL